MLAVLVLLIIIPHTALTVRLLQLVEALLDDASHASALASLAPRLGDTDQTSVRMEIRAIAARLGNYTVRASLAAYLAEPDRSRALADTVTDTIAIEGDDNGARALEALLPYLDASQQPASHDCMLRSCLGLKVVMNYSGRKYRQNIGRGFLLERIGNAAAVLSSIGGPRAVSETARYSGINALVAVTCEAA